MAGSVNVGTEYKLVLNDITGTHTLAPNSKKNTHELLVGNFPHDGKNNYILSVLDFVCLFSLYHLKFFSSKVIDLSQLYIAIVVMVKSNSFDLLFHKLQK